MAKRILIVSAHPDDMEFGCSGTVMKFIEKGYEAFLVIATNGESGWKIKNASRAQRVKTREEEQKKSAKILGIKEVIFLHHIDGQLENSLKFRSELVKIIKRYKPEVVFTFDPASLLTFENLNLSHRDHRAVSTAVFDSVFAAKNKFLFPGEPHKVDNIFFFGSKEPNHEEDITKFIDRKIEALKQHRSQFPDFEKIEQFVREFMSNKSKKGYSESFRVVKVIQMT